MIRYRLSGLGVFTKGALATSVLLLALGGVLWISVAATRGVTDQGRVIHREFGERARTDRLEQLLATNAGLVAERLADRDRAALRTLDRELYTSEAAVTAAISPAIDGTGAGTTAEGRFVAAVRRAYAPYLAVRERLLSRIGRRGGPTLAAQDRQLDEAAGPLQLALRKYADSHARQADRALAQLRASSHGPRGLLAGLLAVALLGLVATLWIARDVVRRLRTTAAFADSVAAGDLATRLNAASTDEIGALATSLNATVETLTNAATERAAVGERERAYRASQDAFSEILQVTENESEAHDMLKHHVERTVAGSELVVLNRNNSQDRLEPTTGLREDSRLVEPLRTANPRTCLAVRLARPYHSGGPDDSLLACAVCGNAPGASTCLPLLVSGEVIGSVLVDHDGPLAERDDRRVHESVALAAPILANLRNLALAESRASTDALTGLPNRRAIQDTLKRMVAHSGRAASPLAAALIDLDHFKLINDTSGHEQGDAVLAAVGDVLSSALRASDFVGRNGGEEFVLLLPDTDAASAMFLADKLRAAIAAIDLPQVNRAITASFGVAVCPDVAGDAETLLRLADRALYAAKGGGRNRVELAGPTRAEAEVLN